MTRFLFLILAVSMGMSAQTIPSLLNAAGQQASVPDDRVVATVDGKNVTAGDVRQALKTLPPEFNQLFDQNPRYAVQQMFMMQFLSDEAEKQKLGEQSPLKEQLAAMRANALASAMLTWEQNSYMPSKEAVAEYYTKNQANYRRAKGKLIVITFKPATPPVVPGGAQDPKTRAAIEAALRGPRRSEEEARARAEEVIQKLKSGANFESLVAEYSDDAETKKDKGASVITYASAQELKVAVLPLAPQQIAGPIKRDNAFIIFKVEENGIQPQAEVETDIYQQLRAAHIREWFDGVSRRFEPAVKAPEFFGSQGQQAAPGSPRP